MAVTVAVSFEEATLSKLDEMAQDVAQPRDQLVAEAVESYVAIYAAQVAKSKRGLLKRTVASSPAMTRSPGYSPNIGPDEGILDAESTRGTRSHWRFRRYR